MGVGVNRRLVLCFDGIEGVHFCRVVVGASPEPTAADECVSRFHVLWKKDLVLA